MFSIFEFLVHKNLSPDNHTYTPVTAEKVFHFGTSGKSVKSVLACVCV